MIGKWVYDKGRYKGGYRKRGIREGYKGRVYDRGRGSNED